MKKSVLEIYALAVCFFTVACFVIVTGMAIWEVVRLSAPEFTLSSFLWQQHQTDDAFKTKLVNEHRYVAEKHTYTPPEGTELTKARETSFAQAIASERRTASQDLIRNLIILLIDGLVFVVHWKIAIRARQSAG